MHQFLKSIGFSNFKKKDLDLLLQDVLLNPTNKITYEREDGTTFVEISKEYGNFFGIALRGEYDDHDLFQMEYYFPYFCGTSLTTSESIDIEQHADRESYAGICDEVRLGVTMIFYLQNVIECFSHKRKDGYRNTPALTYLSGLASKGTIILPLQKDNKQIENNKKVSSNRNHLIAAARNGDEEAIENLTLEDIDTYSMLSRRIMFEDILTIVDTYFMPFGIESEQYSVLGEIMDLRLEKNQMTSQEIYAMTLKCNDMDFDVCINKNDLLGEPEIGRRFKGIVWMQGTVAYSDI